MIKGKKADKEIKSRNNLPFNAMPLIIIALHSQNGKGSKNNYINVTLTNTM